MFERAAEPVQSPQTTKVSPTRKWLMASGQPGRSDYEPLVVSVKIFSQPASHALQIDDAMLKQHGAEGAKSVAPMDAVQRVKRLNLASSPAMVLGF